MGDFIWMSDYIKKLGKRPTISAKDTQTGKTSQTKSPSTGLNAEKDQSAKHLTKLLLKLYEDCSVAKGHNATILMKLSEARSGLTPRLLMGDLATTLSENSKYTQKNLENLESTLILLEELLATRTDWT